MTTIVTVHGTGADAQEDTGTHWWQKSSEFQGEIDQLIEGTDGPIEWVPFHWDGANSERTRRKSGDELLKFLHKTYEKPGKPYHLLGHSHGGSVIVEALRQSTYSGKPLEQLQSWTTVAAPFLEHKKNRFFFNRLSLVLQLVLALLAVYLLQAGIAVSNHCNENAYGYEGCWVEFGNIPYPKDIIQAGVTKIEMTSSRAELARWGSVEKTDEGFSFTPYVLDVSNYTGGVDVIADFEPRKFRFKEDANARPTLMSSGEGETSVVQTFLENYLVDDIQIDLCTTDTKQIGFAADTQQAVDLLCTDPLIDEDLIQNELDLFDAKEIYYSQEDDLGPLMDFALYYGDNNTILISSGEGQITAPESSTPFMAFAQTGFQSISTRERIVSSAAFLGLILMPIAPFAYLLSRSQRKISRRYSKANDRAFKRQFEPTWVSIVDRDDEAVNALSNVVHLKSRIAPQNLLTGFFKMGLVGLMILAFFQYNDELFGGIDQSLAWLDRVDTDTAQVLTSGLDSLMPERPDDQFAYLLESTSFRFYAAEGIDSLSRLEDEVPGTLAVVFGLFLLTALAYLIGTLMDHGMVSPFARRQFNRSVESGLRNVAFGTDTTGEKPYKTSATPRELAQAWQTLPREPHAALSEHVRQYLADMVEKMRALLGMNLGDAQSFEPGAMFDALSWHELIHTSYFDVTEIRWLIAETYASKDGFATKSAFSDDKRTKAQGWLAEMRQR